MPRSHSLYTDLDHNLKYNKELVTLSRRGLRVIVGGKTIVDIPISDMQSAFVEKGIGISRLVARLNSGDEVEVAYFTQKAYSEFNELAAVINSYIAGSPEANAWKKATAEQKGNVETLKWLYKFMLKYRSSIVIGVVLAIILTLLNLIPPYLLEILIDNVLLSSGHSPILFKDIIAILVASYFGVMLVTIGQNYVLNSTGQKIVNDLRNRVYEHVTELSASFIDKMPSGRIISRLTNDVGNTQWLMVWGLPTLIVNVLTIVGIGSILFIINASLAVYVLLPIPVILIALISYKRRSFRFYHRNWRRSSDLVSAISDTIPNHFVMKSFSREDFENKKIKALSDKLYTSQIDVTRLNVSYWPILGMVTALSTVIIWWVGGNQVIQGTLSVGVITAFVAYIIQFYAPINNLSNIVPFIQQGLTSGDRLREVLEQRSTIYNPSNPKTPNLNGPIKFARVGFGYELVIPVIRELNLTVRKGEKLALVGRSGSGKSTISKLLLRFYDVTKGSIKINGTDVREIDLSYLRNRIAYVPQDVVLFDNTVSYNIAYGTPRSVDELEVIASAKAARIHDEIVRLPLVYDTNLGERGSSLSGGQKQRLSIARAIIKMPDVVILDEATSNLDAASEREVFGAMLNLTKGKTSILVTHNINEVINSDRVVVMKDGRKVQEGDPIRLLNQKGELRDLFVKQLDNTILKKTGEKSVKESLSKYLDGIYIIKNSAGLAVSEGSRMTKVNVSFGGRKWRDLTPRLYFPISNRHFVVLHDGKGAEATVITDYTGLDPKSKECLERSINSVSFNPRITSVNGIKIRGDELEWDVVTDRGEIVIKTLSRRNVLTLEDKIVLVDAYDDIYFIHPEDLDKRSLMLVSQTL